MGKYIMRRLLMAVPTLLVISFVVFAIRAPQPTCNVLPAPAIYASTANNDCLLQNIELANQILDEAGWLRGSDGIREKDGVRLSMLYQTSTNTLRQSTQALVKQWWSEIGVEAELRNIDSAVFFRRRPGQPRHLWQVLCRHRDVHQQLFRHRPRILHG